MVKLVFSVILLSFAVDFLLILGVNRMNGYSPGICRCTAAASIDGVFTGVCLLTKFRFLGMGVWPVLAILVTSSVAFGFSGSAVRRWVLFLLLKFAVQGAAVVLGQGGIFSSVLSALIIAVLFAWGLQGSFDRKELIPVEINFQNNAIKLTALRDTGNALQDPLTGERVLVADADTGRKLFGLTSAQLSRGAETLAAGLAPGMRLIPYRTIGQHGAMLLAARMKNVKVGSWQGSAVVAFAPECFGKGEGYQMLIGGMI